MHWVGEKMSKLRQMSKSFVRPFVKGRQKNVLENLKTMFSGSKFFMSALELELRNQNVLLCQPDRDGRTGSRSLHEVLTRWSIQGRVKEKRSTTLLSSTLPL